MRIKNFLFFILLLAGIFSGNIMAQVNDVPIQGFTLLNFEKTLPEELLSTKTAVFVKSPDQWKALAAKAHPAFRKLGIDAVAYYNVKTIRSGKQVALEFAEDLSTRGIDNIILLEKTKDGRIYKLIVTALNKENPFFTHGQIAWKTEGNAIDAILLNLTRSVSTSGISRNNHLILERPAFFYATNIIKGQRFESYNPDLKLDELAVPIFEEIAIPEQPIDQEENVEVLQAMKKHNAAVAEKNKQLEDIIRYNYPFKSEPVSYSKGGEEELRELGYQFVLQRIYAPGKTIKKLLDYETDNKQKSYVSATWKGEQKETRSIPADQPVYKYYVKHLMSGEVYLGTEWDAALTWEDALLNYINNMKEELKIQ